MDQKEDNKAAKATFLGARRVVIWWCLGAAVEELGGWFLWLPTAHKRGGREGKELEDFSCPKSS